MRRGRVPRRRGAAAFVGLLMAASTGCELNEVSLADPPVDVVVVEGLVQLGIPAPDGSPISSDRIVVLLHRTVQGAQGLSAPVPAALVQVTRPDGTVFRLRELVDPTPCLVSTPLQGTGTCYLSPEFDPAETPPLQPGDQLSLEIELLGGGSITGRTVVPGDFDFAGVDNEQVCVLEPDENYPLTWSVSDGARAYVGETQIFGLRAALEPRGIQVEIDPLFLVGLAISASDTTIAFPSEFGVFERFDLGRDVALVLQQGLPPSTWAQIGLTAVDLNYVNWVRGGNFNPSGTVRIPSVRGDGTGFFGAGVTRWLEVLVNPPPQGGIYSAPRCRPPGVSGAVVAAPGARPSSARRH